MADYQIVVRRAAVEDAERVVALSTQLGYPTSPEDSQRYLARVARDASHVVFAAAEDGWVVGWGHVRALMHDDRAAEIEGLVVDEAYRGRGIGRLLIEASERWMRERGCSTAFVRSGITRERAHRFYEGLGYENTKTSLTFRKMLSDGG
jgi:GNAT superfamily N-acetyltransferase